MNELSNFSGAVTPKEIIAFSKNLKKLDFEDFQCLVNGFIAARNHPLEAAEKFQECTKDIDAEVIQSCYPGLYTLLSRAMRLSAKRLTKKKLITDLKELHIEGKYKDSIVEVVLANQKLGNEQAESEVQFETIDEFRWRIDVGISTTNLNRSLQPSILVDLTTSKNKKHIFEMSKEKFHLLRHSVAEILSNIQQIEKRSVFKVED